MEMTILHVHAPIPVTILHLQGRLDGKDDHLLVEEIRQESAAGERFFLIDLTHLSDLNPAGVSTLLSVTSLFPSDAHDRIKLIHIPPHIQKVLDQSGLYALFETCTDLRQAIASFV